MNGSITAFFVILFPLVGILFNLLLSQLEESVAAKGRTRDWTLFFTIFLPTAITSWFLLRHLHAYGSFTVEWLPGISAGIRLTELVIVFACIISNLGALLALYSISFMRYDSSRTRYWFFYLLTQAAILFAIFADNLYWLFGGLEIASIGAFFLISHWYKKSGQEGQKAASAAKRYLIINFCSDILILLSFSFMIVSFKSANLADLLTLWPTPPEKILLGSSSNTRLLIRMLLALGALIKGAQVPLLFWPLTSEQQDNDLTKTPLPASMLLTTTTIGSSGLFLLLVFKPFFYSRAAEVGTATPLFSASVLQLIGWFAAITLLFIVLTLFATKNINRLLIGLAIAQQSFSFLAFSTGSTVGYVAAIFNLIVGLPSLFVVAFVFGAILESLRVADLPKVAGMKQEHRVLFILGIIAIVNFAGIFPTSLYFSRDMLFTALKTSRVPTMKGILVVAIVCFFVLTFLTVRAFQKVMQRELSSDYVVRGISKTSLSSLFLSLGWSLVAGIFLLFYNYPESFLFSGLLNKIYALDYPIVFFSDIVLSPILLVLTVSVFVAAFVLYWKPERPFLLKLAATKFVVSIERLINNGYYLHKTSEIFLRKPLNFLQRFFAWIRLKSIFASIIWAILSLVVLTSVLILVGGLG